MSERSLGIISLDAFLMVFLIVYAVGIGTVVGVDEAEMPRYSVGDKWKIRVDYAEIGGIGMLCTETQEIIRDSVEISRFGESYMCYEIDIKGDGSLYGAVSGTCTVNGKSYISKPDWDTVEFTTTWDGTFIYAGESHSIYQVFKTTHNPPLETSKGFPLTVGKSWSAATTETITRETTIDGQLEQETNTTTGIESYLVHRTELMTVPAGDFDTFVIKVTYVDGSYGEHYYSPEVGEAVKQIEYYQTGELKGTLELIDYSYAAAEEGFPWLWITIGVIITAAAVTGGIGYVLYKRRQPSAPTGPLTTPTEQPQPTEI